MERKIILFRLEGCQYCKKAEQELSRKKIKYQTIEVPQEKSKRALLKQLSGQDSVPVLIEVIGINNQDDDIIEWLKKQ